MSSRLLIAAVLALFSCQACAATSRVSRLAKGHFSQNGVRLPSREFTDAMRAAAVDTSHVSRGRKSLVILAMANEEALSQTVPLFLESLSRVRMSSGRQMGETLDRRLVLVAWSAEALSACHALQAKYSHQCVWDTEHATGGISFSFHSSGFNALGFAKIKYILNGLSAGHDVVFLDTDIVVLKDPLPYFMSRDGDMYASMEKCQMVNDTYHFHSPEFASLQRRMPALNIGVLYFKATAAVTRCVYNWIWDMYGQAEERPNVWDQDIYGALMNRCARCHGLKWQPLDPRTFQSACFPLCGCTYEDSDLLPRRYGAFSSGLRPLNGTRLCSPRVWSQWVLRHFPCSGTTTSKAMYMRNMLEGVAQNKPASITHHWK